MPTYEVTSPSGKKLRITGDQPPTQQELDQIFNQYEVKPERSFGGIAAGVGEAAATMITGAVAEPVSGLVGLARTLTAGPEAGAERVQQFKENVIYQPRTEAGKEYLQNVAEAPILSDIAQSFERGSKFAGQSTLDITGSPAAAAVAEALPAGAAAYLGGRAPQGAAARATTKADQAAIDADRLTRSATGAIDEVRPIQTETTKAFKTLSPEELRDIADVDPEFFKALEDVGVTADPLTSYASKNPQFRGIEQGLAAMPGSSLSPAEQAFRKNLSESATGLMKRYGALDSGEASVKWRESALNAVRQLEDEADAAYDALGQRIDRRQPAQPTKTTELIQNEVADLPVGIADDSAPAVLKKAFAELQPRRRTNEATGEVEMVPANYASLDSLRRKIGAAAFKKEGEFKDSESALLKRVYASLTDDLNAMAESQGLVSEVKQAKAVVAKRKALEEQMQNLLGDKLQKDVEPVVTGAVKELAKGGMQKYKNLMSNIKDPEARQQIVMTSLNNIFTGTRGGEAGDFLNADYLKWYNNTMAKPAIRSVIEKDLPSGAAQKLDSLAKIAEGVTRAKADKVRTGAINSLLDDKAGMVRRMVGGAVQQSVGRIPLPIGEVASSIGSILKADTKRSAAAGQILSSPEFAYLIRRGVAEGTITGRRASKALDAAEKNFMKSKKYKDWAQTLNSDELQAISSLGLTTYLTSQDQQNSRR